MKWLDKIFNKNKKAKQPVKTEYYKLVRNKIPEIIHKTGKKCNYIILDGGQLEGYLKQKIHEEMWELINANTKEEIIDELADVVTILQEYRKVVGITEYEVIEHATIKNLAKGDFSMHIFLQSVEDPQ